MLQFTPAQKTTIYRLQKVGRWCLYYGYCCRTGSKQEYRADAADVKSKNNGLFLVILQITYFPHIN